jgi:hypothetical protein
MEAEAIRDSMLFLSRELKYRSNGGSSTSGNTAERSVYVKVIRNEKDEMLNAFDWADGFASNAVRNVTTTPVQSLLMLNGGWVMKRSQSWSKKLISKNKYNHEAIISDVYKNAYGRSPSDKERALASVFLKSQTEAHIKRAEDLNKDIQYTARMKNGLNAITSNGRRDFYQLLTKDVEMLTKGDFTVEAKIQMNSIHPDSSLRIITSQNSSDQNKGLSWALCVTGKKSRYKPGLLVLRLGTGKKRDLIISDLQLKTGIPYYVGLIADTDKNKTTVKFFLKDYSQKKGSLNQFKKDTKTVLKAGSTGKGSIIMFTDRDAASWDGMIGEMRLSRKALTAKDLMFDSDRAMSKDTVAHWHFETDRELLKDASRNGYHLHLLKKETVSKSQAHSRAVTDFCQVIFNSSEFLYVR